MQLPGVDANLFVVLHALLEERSVDRAARRVGLSPSATSHALGRLREVLGDPLLTRVGRGLVPTPRALALQGPVAEAVRALESVLLPVETVDPATLARAFRVETTDHVQFALLRRVDPVLRRDSPSVDLYVQALQPDTFGRLRRGDVDLAIAVYSAPDADLVRETLFEDRLVAVVRRGHPALAAPPSIEQFAAMEHVLVAPNGSPHGLVDRLLAERGLRRRIARTSATFLDMAFVVAETDAVVSMPESLVGPLEDRLGLARLSVPLALPSFAISMLWHRRSTEDPGHRWFRGLLVATAWQGR